MCTEYSNNIELLYLLDIIVIKKQTIMHILKQKHNLVVKRENQFSSVQLFSHVQLFEIPWTAANQLPCPSSTSGDCSDSCPLSWWCHPTLSSSAVPFSCLQSFPPSIMVFSKESVLRIRGPKYWSFSFSISPSNEYSGLISFRMDWLDLLAVQGTLQSSPTPQFKSINS